MGSLQRWSSCLAAVLFLLVLATGPASASLSMVINADQQLAFAEQLYEEGQYRRAAEEFERFIFFFQNDPRVRTVQLKAGQAFLRAGDPMTALQRLRPLTARDDPDTISVEAHFLAAECHLMLNSPNQAVLQLNNLVLLSDDDAVKDRAYLRIGWIHVEQLDWAGARRAFTRMTAEGHRRHQVGRLESALEQADQLPRKNPVLAGTLSIVPGAGQLYCGRYQDALSAFIVNVGLFWAAYEAFDNDLNVLGGLLAIAGLGFYTGNIYSAVTSAHKYNRFQEERFVDQLKHQVVYGTGPPEARQRHASSVGLVLQLRFPF